MGILGRKLPRDFVESQRVHRTLLSSGPRPLTQINSNSSKVLTTSIAQAPHKARGDPPWHTAAAGAEEPVHKSLGKKFRGSCSLANPE
mmetsp:Transcript_6455/g.10210  ORF Transcript_6455/g.10210 Transcript_6455/m.10210 type:complete len:88 (+) Transcript_6455:2181-2444(+)